MTATLAYLQNIARFRQNVFVVLTEAVKIHSLGQISHALYKDEWANRGVNNSRACSAGSPRFSSCQPKRAFFFWRGG
ncbi:MAG: hypothetical protein ACREO0_11360 [Pseudoxanthomonas sp.]